MFLKVNKDESKLLKFVSRARSTDQGRPVLNGVYINGAVVGCDGFRLHAVRTADLQDLASLESELPEGTYEFRHSDLRVTGQGSVLEMEEIHGNYPDYMQVVEHNNETTGEICFNPQFVRDALAEMDKGEAVRFVINGWNNPLEIHGRINGRPAYALIMPMHVMDDNVPYELKWKPLAETQNG